eukprot:1925478-Lingulodinium_polyedra.AAC.1
MITPPAWVVADEVMGSDVCTGFRKSFVLLNDKPGHAVLESVLKQFSSSSVVTYASKVIEQALKERFCTLLILLSLNKCLCASVSSL